ncbi:MAG TPA: glycoside hydrolase family 43 protein [Paludibacter sp.]|nr:glycoside hydrolase family 43 protein [Paludibacter sp.]
MKRKINFKLVFYIACSFFVLNGHAAPNDAISQLKALIKSDVAVFNKGSKCNFLHENLVLPATATGGATYSYTVTGNGLANNGTVTLTNAIQNATLKVTLTSGGVSADTTLNVTVAPDDNRAGYLFVHFNSNTFDGQQLRFALSTKDQPLVFKALLNNAPVLKGDSIALTKCIRDPHILRGNDGYFYMVMTDMDCNLGWWSNYAIDIMKSKNLVNWKHSIVNFRTKFPGWQLASGSTAVWAPQVIWDPNYTNADNSKGRYLVYYALRSSNVGNTIHFYYNYVNDDFTDLIGEPAEFMPYSNGPNGDIDADIVWSENDGIYHLFYTDGGIKQMVGNQSLVPGSWLPSNNGNNYNGSITSGVEGSTTYRLINSNSYMMLFDTGSNYYYSQSNDNMVTFPAFQVLNKSYFTPRHGTVVTISQQEQDLLGQWNSLYPLLAGAKNIQAKGVNDASLNLAIQQGSRALSLGWNADVATVSAAMASATNDLAIWTPKYKLKQQIVKSQAVTQVGNYANSLQQEIANAQTVYNNSVDTAAINTATRQLKTTTLNYFKTLVNAASNVTTSILNTDFNAASASGWSGTTPGFGAGSAEFYNKTFDFYQRLTNLTNGYYIIYVQGFYRNGANDSGAGYSYGTEDIDATLYGNTTSTALSSLYSVPYTGTNSKNGFSDGLTGSNNLFTMNSDNFANYLVVQVTDGTLTIGLKKTASVSNDWTCFDNFKLYSLQNLTTFSQHYADTFIGSYPVYSLLGEVVGKTDMTGHLPDCLPKGVYVLNGRKIVKNI